MDFFPRKICQFVLFKQFMSWYSHGFLARLVFMWIVSIEIEFCVL